MTALERLLVGLACAAAAAAFAQGQTLYKSVGPDGRIVYSDKAPADGRVEKTLKFENLPATQLPPTTLSAVEQLRRLRASAPPPALQSTVLFSASWCGYCRKAKAYLQAQSVPYQEIDIDTESGRRAFAQAGTGRTVPVLMAQGQRIVGFSPQAYDTVFGRR